MPIVASAIDRQRFHHVDAASIRLLWVNHWWEGPIEARVSFDGRPCYMVLLDQGVLGTNEAWQWVLYRLTEEQRIRLDQEHALFVHHVGAHWCCHAGPHVKLYGAEKPETARYFEIRKAWPALEFEESSVVGVVDDMPPLEVRWGSPFQH